MATSTGPMLAVGGITWVNRVLLQEHPPPDVVRFTVRVAVGTGIAATALSLVERANAPLARGVAWISLVTVLLARIQPGVRSPAENLLNFVR